MSKFEELVVKLKELFQLDKADLDFGLQVQQRLIEDDTVKQHFKVLAEYPHPRVFMTLLGEMDLMILSRLHSIILGTKLGVPIVTVTYDNKVTQFVKLSGQEKWMVTLGEFSAGKVYELAQDRLDQLADSA